MMYTGNQWTVQIMIRILSGAGPAVSEDGITFEKVLKIRS
ncbi:hypothetical protein BSG1_10458 [Bacillus sp. SG-1]|nr:hypothetical protein BSG1_10458 [Bacillus sp. SG-1]